MWRRALRRVTMLRSIAADKRLSPDALLARANNLSQVAQLIEEGEQTAENASQNHMQEVAAREESDRLKVELYETLTKGQTVNQKIEKIKRNAMLARGLGSESVLGPEKKTGVGMAENVNMVDTWLQKRMGNEKARFSDLDRESNRLKLEEASERVDNFVGGYGLEKIIR